MRSFLLFLPLATALVAVGCGGKAVIDGEPGNTGGGGATSSSTTSNGGSSSSSGGSVQGISLERALAFVDCFPGGGGGELFLEFTMSFENVSSQPATIEVVEAKIQGMAGLTTFSVTPSSVTVSPMSTQQFMFEKTGVGNGTSGCDWCAPTDTDLEVELLVDGIPRTFTDAIDSVSCSF